MDSVIGPLCGDPVEQGLEPIDSITQEQQGRKWSLNIRFYTKVSYNAREMRIST